MGPIFHPKALSSSGSGSRSIGGSGSCGGSSGGGGHSTGTDGIRGEP